MNNNENNKEIQDSMNEGLEILRKSIEDKLAVQVVNDLKQLDNKKDVRVVNNINEARHCVWCEKNTCDVSDYVQASFPTGIPALGNVHAMKFSGWCTVCKHKFYLIMIGEEKINQLIKQNQMKENGVSEEELTDMKDWADNFIKALEQDYILPEDF